MNMKCCRCKKEIMFEGESVKFPWFARVAMFVGLIPIEWKCGDCAREEAKFNSGEDSEK